MSGEKILGRYLRRLGLAGPPGADLAGLTMLLRAHMEHVPFENLDIFIRRPPAELRTESVLEKIVDGRRGGFCYEVNEAFFALLRWLGFSVRRIEARVWQPAGQKFGPPFDHLALLVSISDEQYLVDVGYGDSHRAPLRLPRGKTEDVSGRYWLEPWGEGGAADMLLLRAEARPLYVMTLDAWPLAAFQPMCRHHQTSPDSLFAKGLICTRATPSGRITLSGARQEDLRLAIVEGELRRELPAGPLGAALAAHFGMPPGLDENTQ